jgi:8-oxo-dGTP diphosphatase
VTRIHLATALAVREGCVLLVASRYDSHPEPLWNLPGGRQRDGELLAETATRELFEETGLKGRAGDLAYVSESYDGDVHFLHAAFCVEIENPLAALRVPVEGDHVVAAQWVPISQVASRIVIAVVRDPLTAYLAGDLRRRYAGYHRAGVTIAWPRGQE